MVNTAQSDQPRQRSFSGVLSRWGASSPLPRDFKQTEKSAISTLSSPLSSLALSDDDFKGPLGLTTLYEPQPPSRTVADIVFIHGLGGGSRKTWSYSSEPGHYWPRSWLPTDNDFADVGIHTFGYRADWRERQESILDIHDFAQSLLGALQNHPTIRRTDTRIILVGHSMGGCVAKKAYVLARQDPAAANLAGRVHSMFFLATPHRGSDMATMLENVLMVGFGKKPFVADLRPNSAALTAINDTFRHLAPQLHLWSFYETLPTRGAVPTSRLVVDRHSATLGYPGEEIAAMDAADHRHVCKFDTPADPNYKLLRNAMVTAIDMIRTAREPGLERASQSSRPPSEARSLLCSFLGVQDTPEDDLANLQGLKQPGSCQWFTEKASFVSWRSGTSPSILWLIGRPGAGKSILFSHVVELLDSSDAHCSYFIFQHSRSGESTLHQCFRSLAFQMAMHDGLTREALLQLAQRGLAWDKFDGAGVWKRLFTDCIFKISSLAQHFWVLDGLDDCVDYSAFFAGRLLSSLPNNLRLFATSRGLEKIERGLASLGSDRAHMEVLSDMDTLADMRLFLTTRLAELDRHQNSKDREHMCNKVLHKSSGSFLWIRLVLQEFENTWTEEAMTAVLDEVPSDLAHMYSRMVQSIKTDKHKMVLGASILSWIVLACRPLTVGELRCAVKLETNQILQVAGKAIPELCGQLAFVDQWDKFLLADGPRLGLSLLLGYLSGPALKTSPAKPQKALASTRVRSFKRSSVTPAPVDTCLLKYACTSFSEHVFQADVTDDGLMKDICTFLASNNVLSWIEHAATSGDLSPLMRTATNLRGYLGQRVKFAPASDQATQLVDGWATDFNRVAVKFYEQLLDCPSSIYHLIPPLCPPESMISRAFTRDVRALSSPRLIVRGLPVVPWDDCIARIDFTARGGWSYTVSYGEGFFAIGQSNGRIYLYDAASLQVVRTLMQLGGVCLLEICPDDKLLASCSVDNLVVWNTRTATVVQSFPLSTPPMALTFLGADELLGAFRRGCELTKWCLKTGEYKSIPWVDTRTKTYTYKGNQNHTQTSINQTTVPLSPPNRAVFLRTADRFLLALGYETEPILLWDALEVQLIGTLGHDEVPNNGIRCMAFSPNPEIPVLLVSYQSGDLCVFDYITMQQQTRHPDAYATALACSPDGQSVVTGSADGLIRVFDMSHDGISTALTLIYRNNYVSGGMVRDVAFSPDGLRCVDVLDQQARIWAPPVLARRKESELDIPQRETPWMNALGELKITSPLVLSADGRFVVAGKSNGDVVLFSTADATEIGVLYQHTGETSVTSIAVVEAQKLVVSANDGGRLLVVELESPFFDGVGTATDKKLKQARIILDRRYSGVIWSLIVNAGGDRVVVNGQFPIEVLELPSGAILTPREPHGPGLDPETESATPCSVHVPSPTGESRARGVLSTHRGARSVYQHPNNPDWFTIIKGGTDIARVYSWADFTELTSPAGIRLISALPQRPHQAADDTLQPRSRPSYHVASGFVIKFSPRSGFSPSRLYLWPTAAFDPFSTESFAHPIVEPDIEAVSDAVIAVLGIVGASTVVFIDTELWVCSVKLQHPGPISARPASRGFTGGSMPLPKEPGHVRRHFFALSEWRAGIQDFRAAVAVAQVPLEVSGGARSRDLVVFAVGNQLVVVHGGLQFVEGEPGSWDGLI
ncbi:hypothetical protein C8A00DRAFT_43887 [Chaetomidium leptoderma]|uniref:GPI inositol-deacylase n=1 Tax=Chaetomidium leptoderma TaxID=669021 RepID=A0AAN6VKW9_9PEZI|nr:hypothetical protein C8A00DRAFT_43887 [Chaetomidium leptoderma]